MKKVFNLKNQKGTVAIEAVISMSVVLFILTLTIGWYNYMIPRQGLEKQIHLLGQKAKIQGGLTATPALINASSYGTLSNADLQTDLGLFLKTIQDMGHDISKVKITCKSNVTNKNCLGVDSYRSNGSNYLKRQDMDMMIITVEIPAKTGLLSMAKGFFGNTGLIPERYVFSEAVMSERW